MTVTL